MSDTIKLFESINEKLNESPVISGVEHFNSEEVEPTSVEDVVGRLSTYMENAGLTIQEALKEVSNYVNDSVFFEILAKYESYMKESKDWEPENLTQAISIVAKEFKDRVIEEYKNNNDMSKELNDAIAFRLSELGVSSPEDWVGDVCYEILDMTPDGTPLAMNKLNEDWEPTNLELDDNGLPALDRPYYMKWSEEQFDYYIYSSHPYDLTDYSWAKSQDADLTGKWDVYSPDNKKVAEADNYEAALQIMKDIDSKLTARIDRT